MNFFTVEETTLLESVINGINQDFISKELLLDTLGGADMDDSAISEILESVIKKLESLPFETFPKSNPTTIHIDFSDSLLAEGTPIVPSPFYEAEE